MSSIRFEAKPERGPKAYELRQTSRGREYVFELKDRLMVIEEDIWAEMIHLYTFEGGNKTLQEVANTYELPRKDLEIAFRMGGIFKRSPAWSREAIEEAEGEDLALMGQATYEAKLRSYGEFSVRNQLREQRKELEVLRDKAHREEKMHEMFAESLQRIAPTFRSWKVEKTVSATRKGEPWVCHAPMADLHAGLYVWGKELWGGDYDLSIAKETVIAHARDVAEWIRRQPGRCETCYFTDIGDYFHAVGGATDKGTPLHQDTRSKKVLDEATEAKFEAVEIIRKVAGRVVLMGTSGNHDNLFHYDLFRSLRYYFRMADDVEVYDALRPETTFLVGDTLHVLLHGRGLRQLGTPSSKMKVDVMLQEVVGSYWNVAKRFIVYVGDLHEVQVATHGRKTLMKRLPAAAPTDDYAQGGFFSHQPGAQSFRLYPDGQIEDEHSTYFDYHQD